MGNLEYINRFDIRRLEFDKTYTTGSLQSYARPCIGYLLRGVGKFFYNGNTYFAKEGDLIYIAKDTKYYSVWYGEPEIKFYSISFDFTHPYANYDYRFQIVNDYPRELFDEMMANFSRHPSLSLSKMYALLDDIYPKLKKDAAPIQNGAIENAIIHIESNYFSPIEIDELCRLCHLSRSSLFDAFKRRTGVSPIGYKHNVMIQHALDMLAHTELTVEEISQKVGFSSSNYFRTVFFKLTGKTPKEVRHAEQASV